MSFYDYKATKMNGKEVSMEEYKGKVVLVVNTASKCGFTYQFGGLEELNQKYRDKGLAILGFPCDQFAHQDPGTNEEIEGFCKLNFGVTFDMFQKIKVNGKDSHPLYEYLKDEAKGPMGKKVTWNFTKFLVDREGKVLKRYAPQVKPQELEEDLLKLL